MISSLQTSDEEAMANAINKIIIHCRQSTWYDKAELSSPKISERGYMY
jgi:hypothetical protein